MVLRGGSGSPAQMFETTEHSLKPAARDLIFAMEIINEQNVVETTTPNLGEALDPPQSGARALSLRAPGCRSCGAPLTPGYGPVVCAVCLACGYGSVG